MMKRFGVLAILTFGALAGRGDAQPAKPDNMPALVNVLPGQWDLKSRDDPSENRSICLKDVRMLIQLRHGGAICNRFVISSGVKETTVHYTCPGNGYGRTTIRVETPRLLQIETQGIAEKEPFAATIEARRAGECTSVTGRLQR
jgi:hypothetical protein